MIHIIYGRAGSGKSEYIYRKIKKSLEENKNQKIYIITPEQFSFTAERRLLDTIETGAVSMCEVLSFQRMAYRVMSNLKQDKKVIEKAGKSMISLDIINKNQDNLNFLGKTSENIDVALNQITEFKKHNITVENLQKQIENTEDEYLKLKLNDSYILYKNIEEKINEKFIDDGDVLNILAKNLVSSHLFDNSVFYIDEFAGFTKQEYSIIEQINLIAKNVYITICTDSLRVTLDPENDVFYDNKQTCQTLMQTFDLRENDQIYLNNNKRFKNNELKHLEQNLFKLPYEKYEEKCENISLYLAENSYEEILHIADEIMYLIRAKNYRFKDVAIISNDMENYSDIVKAIFSQYGIPIFIDEDKDVTQNIIIKYVLGIIDILAKDFSYDSVINYVKLGLSGIDDIYEFENYCLKWGIKGNKWYKEKWSYETNLKQNAKNQKQEDDNQNEDIDFNLDQEKLVRPLIEFKESLKYKKNMEEISKQVYDFLCKNLRDSHQEIFEDEENVKAWNAVVDVLNEIIQIFGKSKTTMDNYFKILSIGISNEKLGQIPETQDKVTLGDINRSKTHKIKAMFIIGVNDGYFPKVSDSEGFLNDKDRENLKKQGFELAKGTKEKMYEENFNIYNAFSAAEEKLYISYVSGDSEGKPLRRALIISRLRNIFPELEEKTKNEVKDNVEELTKTSAISKLLKNINSPEYKEIYKWYEKNDKEKLDNALESLNFTNLPQKISKQNMEKLYGKKFETSISKMEKYSGCPFSYFLTYELKLNEKERLEIKNVDTGSFMHDILDEFFKRAEDFMRENGYSEDEISIKNMKEEDVKKLIQKIVDEKLPKNSKFNLTAKYRVLTKRLERVVLSSLKYILQSLKQSSFNIYGTEIGFGKDVPKENANKYEKTFPPIEIELKNGKKVSIVGKIDRVDIAKLDNGKYIRIIDYKSSSKTLDLNEFKSGLNLQLITYSNEICKNLDNVNPAGALYFTLLEPSIGKFRNNISQEEIEKIVKQEYKMDGIIVSDAEVVEAMDNKIEETGKSDIIQVQMKDDKVKTGKNVVTREQFEELQKYSQKLIKNISEEIISGNIDIKPSFVASKGIAKTPCNYCKFKSICMFDTKIKGNSYRYISNKSKEKIFEEIREDE